MKIEKRNYSRSPWRLVTAEGKEVTAKMPFEHPTLGWTYVDSPICGETKAECMKKSLDLLNLLMLRQQHGVNA